MSLPRLGDLLVEAGVITQEQLQEALAHQRAYGGRLGTCLVELGFIDENKVARALAEQFHIPAATATQIIRIRPEVLAYIPAGEAERLRALPMREDAGKVWVALAEPTDARALKDLQRLINKPVRTMVAPERLIQYGLEKHYKAQRKRNVVAVKEGTGPYASIPSAPPPPGASPAYHPFEQRSSETLENQAAYLDETDLAPALDLPSTLTPRLQLADVIARIREAQKDDQILEAAMSFVAQDVQHSAIFLLRGANLEGWRGINLDSAELTRIRIPVGDLPLVGKILTKGEAVVGEMAPGDLLQIASLFSVTRAALGIFVPIRIGGRATGLLFGAEATLDALRHRDDYVKLGQKMDYALHIAHLKRLLAQP